MVKEKEAKYRLLYNANPKLSKHYLNRIEAHRIQHPGQEQKDTDELACPIKDYISKRTNTKTK